MIGDQISYVIGYVETNFPMIAFVLGAVWGALVWMKRQFLDSVYATKHEVRMATEELEGKMQAHEDKDNDRYHALMEKMNDNHDEIKDLIIEKLDR